jgi:N-acetylmuramoyl-L-alanine amidase
MRMTRRQAAATLALAALPCAGCGALARLGGASPARGDGAAPSAAAGGESVGPASPPLATGAASAAPSPSASAALPLAGKVVGIDPGHNGGNFGDPGYINQLIWNGREQETCDTCGTQTAGGYTEAQFSFNVAGHLRADLMSQGAKVVVTRRSNDGVGPCVNRRAQIINAARADVAIDIHADGGPVWGRGFTVLEPVADGPNDKVISASVQFGAQVRAALLDYTAMPQSDYYGHDGVIFRNDLAGLNLTTVPKVLIECGNMPNPTDAALLVSPGFQRDLAHAFAKAITKFLTSL